MDTEITTKFVKANGLTFEVQMCGAGDNLALCLHGFPEHAFSWRFQLPLLAQLGYTVWAPNLRGYGRSSQPERKEDYALDHLLADVAGFIDAANARSTLLVGQDWGGLLAWLTAIQQVRPLERLIVLNMAHPLLFINGQRRWSQLRKSWYMYWFQVPKLPELALGRQGAKGIGDLFRAAAVDKSRFPEEVLNVYRQAASQPGALTAMLNYYRANLRWYPARLSHEEYQILTTRLEIPTLLLWGEDDIALDKELTYGTDAWVSDLTIRYLPRVGHFVQQEAPETVNMMIEAWLTGKDLPEAG